MSSLLGKQKNKEESEYMAPRKHVSTFSGPLTFAVIVVAVIFLMSVSFRVENIH